jgi:hypothetical protein
VGGVDLNKLRIRTVLAAVLALALSRTGFSVGELAAHITSTNAYRYQKYTRRQAAYDLKKLRAKGLIARLSRSRRYIVQPHALKGHRRPAHPLLTRQCPTPQSSSAPQDQTRASYQPLWCGACAHPGGQLV